MGIGLLPIVIFLLDIDLTGQDYLMKSASVESIKSIAFEKQVSFGLPIRLKIPNINIDSTLDYVGITPEGAIGAPKDPASPAWFNLGARPGENGSAVIVGHFGWKNNAPAVFDNLHKLRTGDKLSVTDENGITVNFRVSHSKKYDSKADVSSVFDSGDKKARLILITCEGTWNKSEKSYSDRLVVFADKV